MFFVFAKIWNQHSNLTLASVGECHSLVFFFEINLRVFQQIRTKLWLPYF